MSVHRLVGFETRRGDGYAVGSWLEMNDAEISRTVGRGSLFSVGCIFDDSDGCAADDGARGIDHRASHGAIDGRLGAGDRGNQSAKQDQQGEDTESRSLGHLALLKIGVVLLMLICNRVRDWGRSRVMYPHPRRVFVPALSQVTDKIWQNSFT